MSTPVFVIKVTVIVQFTHSVHWFRPVFETDWLLYTVHRVRDARRLFTI